MIMKFLSISVAVLLVACWLLGIYTKHLAEQLERSEEEISHLSDTLDAKVKEAEIADRELTKLTQNLAVLRKTAVKNEDKLTNAIRNKKDSCTDAIVSDDILNILQN